MVHSRAGSLLSIPPSWHMPWPSSYDHFSQRATRCCMWQIGKPSCPSSFPGQIHQDALKMVVDYQVLLSICFLNDMTRWRLCGLDGSNDLVIADSASRSLRHCYQVAKNHLCPTANSCSTSMTCLILDCPPGDFLLDIAPDQPFCLRLWQRLATFLRDPDWLTSFFNYKERTWKSISR